MPNYVTRTKVTDKLPSGHGLSNDTIDAYIEDASGEVDELAGYRFSRQFESSTQKFPEITDVVDITPKTIEMCALWLTLSRCYEDLGDENRGDEEGPESNKKYYRRLAVEKMQEVATGELDLDISLTSKFSASEKYPDDESDRDAVFTNTELDSYLYN